MKAYFVSGMAADERVFKYVRLPEGYEIVHLTWITPQKDESLPSYALRMAERIDTSQPFILVGLSFGGMLVTEIAKRFPPVKTILIASIPLSTHLPGYFRVAAILRLHKVIPIGLVKTAARLKRFITNEKSEDKKLLWEIIRSSDPAFIRWSMEAILKWKNEEMPQPVLHIHGTRDEILPARYTKPTHIIPKAGHLIVMTSPDEVNTILYNALAV
ncbi:alpha/beta hydrolase [Pseudoflavitalea sp. X16]|uniref:alpha/beta fold hydrolase n=1 Tax=Paraflavitalea devenefica TaxID=2716334 RepID=UPI001420F60F|nr:alpha/beta hydrolase [Paraflavitalea devenefica]NII25591.1 alpha/beta hydrolase [Paraflavitalea devenefica]